MTPPCRPFVFQLAGQIHGGFTVCRRDPLEAMAALLDRLDLNANEAWLKVDERGFKLTADGDGRDLAHIVHGMDGRDALIALMLLRDVSLIELGEILCLQEPAPPPRPALRLIQGGRA